MEKFKNGMKGFEGVNFGYQEDDKKRKSKEIQKFESIMFDRIWYERALCHIIEDPKSISVRKSPMDNIVNKYGKDFLPLSEESPNFDWGYLNGILATLRWVLGDEMDDLDS